MLSFPASAGAGFSGDHGGKATPVPIPNTVVKGLSGEGTAGFARGRVARRRNFISGPVGLNNPAGPFFMELTVKLVFVMLVGIGTRVFRVFRTTCLAGRFC